MNKILNNTLVAVFALLLLGSCSKKVVVPVTEPTVPTPAAATTQTTTVQATSKDLSAYSQADWSTFKTGGNAEIVMNSKNMSSSMQMRMTRGSAIYISLRPMLGIEVGKIVIWNDSIMLVDKLHKQYILEKASLLTGGVPVTVENLQDLFLGRAFEVGGKSLTNDNAANFDVVQADGKTLLKPKQQYKGYEYQFAYDARNNIVSLNVQPSGGGSGAACAVDYDDIKGTIAGKLPTSVTVSTAIKSHTLQLILNYKDPKWNESLKIETDVPTKYKRMSASSISSMFGNED